MRPYRRSFSTVHSKLLGMLSLLIYEDNDKLRKTLQLYFDSMEDIAVAGAYRSCESAARHVAEHQAQVVLMDIDMPGISGIEGARLIKEHSPDTRVLMHTVFDDDQKIFNSLAAGADGYMLKNATPDQLYRALKDIHAGGAPMSPGVARRVLQSFRESKPEQPVEDLSVREREVLQYLAQGYTYKRISSECGITIDTTRTHIKNIYTKLHVNCGTEAVAKAMRMKLVSG